ncbi:hypothetical protein pb186bvf_010650 [Paramecium bursaria]
MNRYSLKFTERIYEKEYQNQQQEQLRQSSTYILSYVSLITFIIFAIRVANQDYEYCWLSLSIGCLLSFVVYKLKTDIKFKKYILFVLKNITFISSVGPLLFFLMHNSKSYSGEILQNDISMIGSICFIKTSNFGNNTFFYLMFIFSRSYRHFQDGTQMMNFVFLFGSLVFIMYDYQTVKYNRQQFLTTKCNQIQIDIIDKFIRERILIAKYDHENLKFKSILVNDSLKDMVDLVDTNVILKDIILLPTKITLYSFILQNLLKKSRSIDLLNRNQFVQSDAYYKTKSQKFTVEIMIHDIIEQTFILRIVPKVTHLSNDSAAFYKRLLVKLRKFCIDPEIHKLVNKEIMKNIVSSFAKMKYEKINYNIKKLYLNIEDAINQFIDSNTCQFKYYNSRQLITDPLLFSSILFMISKMCVIKCCVLKNNQTSGVDLSIYGISKQLDKTKNKYFLGAIEQIHRLIGLETVDLEINLISNILKIQFNIL